MGYSIVNLLVIDEKKEVAPFSLAAARFGYIASRAIGVAVELGLFTHIARGADTVERLAQACGASPRGIRILADAMVVQNLLKRDQGRLELTAEARHFLVSDGPAYIGGMILHADAHWNRWAQLGDAVRLGGSPQQAVESDADGGRYFAPFVASLHRLNLAAAQTMARELHGKVRRILDLGAGSGVWSLPLAAADREVRVDAVDRQTVLETVTMEYAREAGCADQYRCLAGNLRDLAWEAEGNYDLVILGHVLHSEGWERSQLLLQRTWSALRPGGLLLIAEMIPDENRSSDLYGVLFGLQMLMFTEEGDVFTAAELETMTREAGFADISWHPMAAAMYPLMLARRP